MATSTGVKYIGKNAVYEDNILRTGLTWSKGEVHILPSVMAKEFLKHPAMFSEVQGATYLTAAPSDQGVDFIVGGSRYPFKTEKSSLGVLLDGFGSLAGHSIGSGGTMALTDSTPPELKKPGKSIQVTVPAGTSKNFDITLPGTNVCPNKHLKVILENLSNDMTGSATWYISNDAGLANHYYTSISINKIGVFSIDAANSSSLNRWTVGAGTPSFDGLAKMRFTLVAPASSDLNVIFHGVYASPAKRTCVRLIQDDGMLSGYTEFLPLLNKYGFKAGFSIIKNLIGGGGYMTLNMLDQLYAEGHDIMPHGDYALSTFASSAEAVADIKINAEFLLDKGYLQGSTVYVFPQGVWSFSANDRTSILNYLKSAGYSHAFIASGSTDSNTRGIGKYTIARYPVNATVNTASLLAALDLAVESGQDLTVMFHAIVPSGATGDAANRADVSAILDGISSRVLAGKCDVVNPADNIF